MCTYKIVPKDKAVLYRRPDLAEQWHPTKNGKLTAGDVALFSNIKRWWRCSNNHEWQASPNERSKHGCPYCSGRKANKDNCLASLNSKLAKEWHPTKNGKLTPYDVTNGSSVNVWWLCPICSNSFQVSVWERASKHRNCNSEICRKKRILKNNYDTILSISCPNIAKDWNYKKNYPLTPDNVYRTSKNRVWWICSACKFEWKGVIQVRCEGQRKCPSCNSLASLHPRLLKEWCYTKNNVDPYTVNPNTHDKFWWICRKNKNHIWEASPNMRVSSRMNNGIKIKPNGCPFCSNKKVSLDNCLATKDPELIKEWDKKANKLTPYDVVPFSDKKVHWICPSCSYKWVARVRSRSHGQGCPSCAKIGLKNGAICDSLIEAYFYMKFKNAGLNFVHHGYYGGRMGRSQFDFYFPSQKRYVEVTSYNKECFLYKSYFKKIQRKRYFVEQTLGGKFEFIQRCFSVKDYEEIKKYICRDRRNSVKVK